MNSTLTRAARQALIKLGEDIAIARKKRRISTTSMTERAIISRGTLNKVEKGGPSVSMGVYATVLSILGLVESIGDLADRSADTLGPDIDEDRLSQKNTAAPKKQSQASAVMTDIIEIYIDHAGETHLVGLCRYLAKRHGLSSVFEYTDEWLDNSNAFFALDPVNMPLGRRPIYITSDKSALLEALRDIAPGRRGQQLIKRAFRKASEKCVLSEIDYLLAITDQARIGALRYKRANKDSFDHDIGHYRIPPLIQLPALTNEADLFRLIRKQRKI